MLNTFLIVAAISAILYLTIASGLILSQQPKAMKADSETLDFSHLGQNAHAASGDAPALRTYKARDGGELGYRFWPATREGAPLLILLHGSGWHGGAYVAMAEAIAGDGRIAVALPDLRGHGVEPERRGDLDYIGQFEDDLADLIGHLRQAGQPIVLAGHSSGGGLVVRYAGGAHGNDLGGAVLIAPFLQYDAPTTRPNSGGWANVATRRIVGLAMLNNVGITALNSLPVISFNFPDRVLEGPLGQTATRQYSYRLNASFSPRRDWKGDLAKLPPFLLVAGKDDEAFRAEAYEAAISEATGKGRYELIDDVGHLDIILSEEVTDIIRDFVLVGMKGSS